MKFSNVYLKNIESLFQVFLILKKISDTHI